MVLPLLFALVVVFAYGLYLCMYPHNMLAYVRFTTLLLVSLRVEEVLEQISSGRMWTMWAIVKTLEISLLFGGAKGHGLDCCQANDPPVSQSSFMHLSRGTIWPSGPTGTEWGDLSATPSLFCRRYNLFHI